MRARILKWGNSLAIRIPKTFAEEMGVSADAEVELAQSRGRLVVTPVRSPRYRLADLLSGVTARNLHKEQDFGAPVGREVL